MTDSFRKSKAKLPEDFKEISLPNAKLNCPLSINHSQIHQLFHTAACKLGFSIIEEEESFSTAVYRKLFSMKALLFWRRSKPAEQITAVKLEIVLNESACCRLVKLNGLYGVTLNLRCRTPL